MLERKRLSLFLLLFLAACNPFAPAIEQGNPFQNLLGDPTTVDGFFTNFKNAYELRDMSIYQPLIDSSFVFSYRDEDKAIDRQWGFAQEMESTRNLFQNANLIRLDWNQVVTQEVFDANKTAKISRSFNLTIALVDGETFRGSGKVNFWLTRRKPEIAWKLRQWRDESEL
jgi:hypothetical protein